MGNGIAHVFAQNNYQVNLIDVNEAQLKKAIETIGKNLDRMVSKGSISEELKAATLANITTYTNLKEACTQADLIVEAASENKNIKLEIFKQIDEFADMWSFVFYNLGMKY